MTIDISAVQRAVQRLRGDGWTVPVCRAVYEATVRAWESAPEADDAGLVAEGEAFASRLRRYGAELEEGVVPLGLVERGGRLVPDYVYPWSWRNQVAAEREASEAAWSGFLTDLREGLERVVVTPVRAVASGVTTTAAWLPVLVGFCLSVAGGVLVWRLTRSRPQLVRVVADG